MPYPKKNEDKAAYLKRCMSSDKANSDFPDSAQRYAFCQSEWSRGLKESSFSAGAASQGGLVAEDVGKGISSREITYLKKLMPSILKLERARRSRGGKKD